MDFHKMQMDIDDDTVIVFPFPGSSTPPGSK